MAKAMARILKVRLPPSPSVSAIIEKDKKLCAVKLSYKNGYALPGGMLESEESFESALKREVFEETGLKIRSVSYFNEYAFNIEYPTINIVFTAKAIGKIKPSHEGIPEWIHPKDLLPKLVYQDNSQAVSDYIKILPQKK